MGVGSDFHAQDDITRDWRMAKDERTAFAQALYRRLQTLTGSLMKPPSAVADPDEQTYARNYGLGVFRYMLESGLTNAQIAIEIERDLLKDERVRSVRVDVANNVITIRPTSHGLATYPHTLTIDRVTGAIALGLE